MKPRLLDLFCGAGGCTAGYQRAGFYVVGVDNRPQPNYCGDKFVRADALEVLEELHTGAGRVFDAIHASPPCQAYSGMSVCRDGLAGSYPELIAPVRKLLRATGLPYVIENVERAPLIDPVMLCGTMFGLPLYRHRLFETSFPVTAPLHAQHWIKASKAGHHKPGSVISVAGNCAPIAKAREAMGIDWTTRDELAEAVPPAYTEHIGQYLMAEIKARKAAA